LLEPVIEDLKHPELRDLYGVNEEEANELARRIRSLPALCAQLAEFGIEETIVHGDLWGPNTIVRDTKSDKGPLIFDWTDASIGHPFFDIYMSTTSEKNEARRTAQRQAHIDVWSEVVPRDKVIKALEMSEYVAPYYYVHSFRKVELNAPAESRWELIYLLQRFARFVLTAKEPIHQS
jgi:aminoglycoside phosphotransferase (APT) family kinase protein